MYDADAEKGVFMGSTTRRDRPDGRDSRDAPPTARPSTDAPSSGYAERLEAATRGLLELNVAVLDQMDKTLGVGPLRALQALERLGPCLVTELGNDLNMLVSTASRLSDRLADAGLITRRVAPTNRRATLLELTDAGRDVLAELITIRTTALREVTDQLSPDQRHALLTGTQAFTTTWRHLGDHPDPQRQASDS
jgi:DNA-binding MarR family transcriptional regulator